MHSQAFGGSAEISVIAGQGGENELSLEGLPCLLESQPRSDQFIDHLAPSAVQIFLCHAALRFPKG